MSDEVKNEVALAAQNALATYKAEDDFQDVRPQDKLTPRIRLQQMTSPSVAEGKAAAGDYMLDSGEVILHRGGTTKIIPLMHWLQWVEFNPDRDAAKDKRVFGRSVDPNGDLAIAAGKYEEVVNPEGKKVFRVTESYNFAVLLPSIGFYDTVYIISLQRASHRVGKGLINTLLGQRQSDGVRYPFFASMFDLGNVFKDEGPQKKYFVPTFEKRMETPQAQWPGLAVLVTKLRADKKAMMDRELEREHDDTAAGVTAASSAKDEKHF